MPILNKIVKKYKKSDVVFISFANDDSTQLKEFLLKTKFNFKVVASSGRTLIDTFKLFSIWPTSVIIDKKGIIRLIKIGEIDLASTDKLIEKLLR